VEVNQEMSRIVFKIVGIGVIALALAGVVSCSPSETPGPAVPVGGPASDRMAALAGIPPESDAPPAIVVLNPAPLIDTATLSSANLEASVLKSLVRGFLAEHPGSRTVSSGDLRSLYSGGPPKAEYYFDAAAIITRVDSVSGGWDGIVFSLSGQSWRQGTPEGDRVGDQDVP
jgi:hypothetical protein